MLETNLIQITFEHARREAQLETAVRSHLILQHCVGKPENKTTIMVNEVQINNQLVTKETHNRVELDTSNNQKPKIQNQKKNRLTQRQHCT